MTQDYRTPGQLLQALLDERGWTQRVLAVVLGIEESRVQRIVGGTAALKADLALALADIFGIPANRFLDLQQSYDLARAEILAKPDPTRAARARLYGDLPISEMIKRGWLDASDVRDVAKVEVALGKFFGVDRLEDIEITPHVAKKTGPSPETTPAQLAWLYRVRQIACGMMVKKFTVASVKAAVEKLRGLLNAPAETRLVPRILSECGIRYVIVETLGSAKIDGVCTWLNDSAPVVGMSLRYDRNDNFWFVLRHELEHVIRRHGRKTAMLDAELEGDNAGTGPNVADEERIANTVAAEFCVPRQALHSFVRRKSPYFYEKDFVGFARLLGVHPGVVAGQLQRETGQYNLFRTHLVRVRAAVAASAPVDGWGTIAPV